jgi:TPR repeat protein
MSQTTYQFDTVVALLKAREFAQLVEYVTKFAESGVADAECELGNMYLCGQGVPVNPVEAERWLTKAAQQDHPIAWNNLGTLYSQCDIEKSRRCFERAFELGFVRAAHHAK